MRLYEELFKDANSFIGARCTITPKGGGYFEGVKAVEDFTAEKILLCLARERVEICGEGLFIKKYCDGDMEIGGKISALIVLSKGGMP